MSTTPPSTPLASPGASVGTPTGLSGGAGLLAPSGTPAAVGGPSNDAAADNFASPPRSPASPSAAPPLRASLAALPRLGKRRKQGRTATIARVSDALNESQIRPVGTGVCWVPMANGAPMWVHTRSLAPQVPTAQIHMGLRDSQIVAVKQQQYREDDEHVVRVDGRCVSPDRHRREARLARLCAAPGDAELIDVTFFDYHSYTSLPYGVTDLSGLKPAALTPPQRLAMLRGLLPELLRHLQRCHDAGVVHADIKPANVVVRPSGAGMLVDFGESFEGAAPSGIEISNNYAPAEIWAGGPPSMPGDVFSLGAVLLQFALGLHSSPFMAVSHQTKDDVDARAFARWYEKHLPASTSQLNIETLPQDNIWGVRAHQVLALDAELATLIFAQCLHSDPALRATDLGRLASSVESLPPLAEQQTTVSAVLGNVHRASGRDRIETTLHHVAANAPASIT